MEKEEQQKRIANLFKRYGYDTDSLFDKSRQQRLSQLFQDYGTVVTTALEQL